MRRRLAKVEVAGVHRLEAWAVEKTMEAKVVVVMAAVVKTALVRAAKRLNLRDFGRTVAAGLC